MPGVGAVFRSEDIESGHAGDEGLAGIVRRSHFPGRSGDLIVVPKPYWITSIEAATHGTGYGYDAHVPVVLMGKGIKPGEYLQPATPADIAPTLGFLMGVTLYYDGQSGRASKFFARAAEIAGAAGGHLAAFAPAVADNAPAALVENPVRQPPPPAPPVAEPPFARPPFANPAPAPIVQPAPPAHEPALPVSKLVEI